MPNNLFILSCLSSFSTSKANPLISQVEINSDSFVKTIPSSSLPFKEEKGINFSKDGFLSNPKIDKTGNWTFSPNFLNGKDVYVFTP